MEKTGIVFPGQGSQYVGMGKEIFDEFEEARETFSIGSEITGIDLKKICFEGPLETLTETSNCQTAVFAVNISCFRVLMKEFPFIPCFAAGHSLGEYAAFAAAGSISIKDSFLIVQKRAHFMKLASEKNPGSMLAILGKTEGEVKNMARDFNMEISNINSPGQIVVGGKKESVKKFSAWLAENHIKFIPLKVSGAFHTSLMGEAAYSLKEELEKITINPPLFPVYTNFNGEILNKKDDIKEALLKQIVSPVQWVGIVSKFPADSVVVEIGPKKVLSGLINKISPGIKTLNMEDKKTLKETIAFLQKENTIC